MAKGLKKISIYRMAPVLMSSLLLMSCGSGSSISPVTASAENEESSLQENSLANTPAAPSTDEAGESDNADGATIAEVAIVEAEPIIDTENLYDYANQLVPFYIQKDNTAGNIITDAGATLGRVLFYDPKLSSDNTVSCSSCHQQSAGFSDTAVISDGVNGETARHSMRLVNARFAEESRFFWDERAETLEAQVTQPIRDHGEMGFSGTDGAPSFDDLLDKLTNTTYYPDLFTSAFGNPLVTEVKMQSALAQFIRSIQSFDSRYDEGRSQVGNNNSIFANFTIEENEGKRLFMQRGNFDPGTGERLAGGGLGCNGCHRAPEFDIDPSSRNNGVISIAGNLAQTDENNTRSPSLRDLFRYDGTENGPFMHDGSLPTFNDVLDHYNDITADRTVNRNLDNRLSANGPNGPNGNNGGPDTTLGQKLLLTETERSAISAFIKTLSGQNIYTDPKWSNPFVEDGSPIVSRSQGQ